MELPKVRPGIPVRWPFRILAALIVLAGVVAVIGTGVMGWSEADSSLKWQFLASLPGMAWFVRLAGYAAIRGKSPAAEYWPFASDRVFLLYFIIWLVVADV